MLRRVLRHDRLVASSLVIIGVALALLAASCASSGSGAGQPDGRAADPDPDASTADPDAALTADADAGGPDAGMAAACVDECVLGAEDGGRTCQLWNDLDQVWIDDVQTGDGHLHNRARVYTQWLRQHLLPAGGVMRGYFTDDTFDQIQLYAGTRDSPIWTGIYLGSEALRYAETGSPDALAQARDSVAVLDRWWRISGDRGYLARYAAPANSPAPILAIFDPADTENHRDVSFEGATWHWKGNVSRDQYQGVFFGYALAYDLIDDPALEEMIRSQLVATVEQLMEKRTRSVDLIVNGVPLSVQMELDHVIYTDDETPSGKPSLTVTTSPFDAVDRGFLSFWPNPAEYLRQLPLLSWLPDVPLRSQAVQLGGMFAAALHVTDGVPAYAARRQAIAAHYDAHFAEWLDMAKGWENNNQCGSSYHGLNIAFLPAYNWVRLEADPTRRAQLRDLVLRDRMWAAVADHKNVFFAYIYGSQVGASAASIIAAHTDQLRQFPVPPNVSVAVDNRASYAEDPDCPGLSATAIDVADRVPASFLWERNPWTLVADAEPHKLYPGIDYLITYWMARYYGYLADDAPNTCLRWRN